MTETVLTFEQALELSASEREQLLDRLQQRNAALESELFDRAVDAKLAPLIARITVPERELRLLRTKLQESEEV